MTKPHSLFFVLAMGFGLLAQAQHEIPTLSGPVIDELHVLSAQEASLLEEKIRSHASLAQAQVWIVSSLDNEPIESLSIRAVEKWKLGTEKKDNGLLILVAFNDHRMRIEVGQGLEGNIPDISANRITLNIMRPEFRSGRVYAGLDGALSALYELASGSVSKETNEKLADQEPPPTSRQTTRLVLYIILFIIFSFILPRRRGFRGGYYGGSSWGGGGGWSSGGGGGWSGGGGGFSGGGSSGSW